MGFHLGSTIFSKVWDSHVLTSRGDESLLYIDRHLTHEVTSPIAFENLRAKGRKVRRPDLTFAVMDHNVPTGDRSLPVTDPLSLGQMEALSNNASESGITLFDLSSQEQGIVHIIGPELGLTLPGITLVCGDSHTTTHGAFGALALGIGTTEGEHVLATQALWVRKPRQMEIRIDGTLQRCVTAKDVILSIISKIGTGGAIGYAVEFTGRTVADISLEERMTLTNMAVEAGAKTAIVSPDKKTYSYLKGARYSPKGTDWDDAVKYWKALPTDPGSRYDRTLVFDVSRLEPQVTWGTNPSMAAGITGRVPSPDDFQAGSARETVMRALRYMGLAPGTKIADIDVDVVFIGSCTNARFSDILDAARVVSGRTVSPSVRAMVVPGSQSIKRRAELIGLDRVFRDAGFEWRNSGCSMCIGMNGDALTTGQRCASTSNRNFENRQGPGGRTHLVSPMMAAAAAVSGRFVDIRDWDIRDVEDVPLRGDEP